MATSPVLPFSPLAWDVKWLASVDVHPVGRSILSARLMPTASPTPSAPDRRGADAVAELEQLALEPLVSPTRVLPRHPHRQGGEAVLDRWPCGPVGVGPSSADEAAMPAQDRARGDQAMATQRPGQPLDEGGEDRPVGPVDARSWVGARVCPEVAAWLTGVVA